MKIFCLIPAYNEKGNLLLLIEKLYNLLEKLRVKSEIFFVIQGTDGSEQLLRKIKKTHKEVDWIYFKAPLGIGKAYKEGFKKVKKGYTHVLTLDADLNHDPSVLPSFIKKMKETDGDIIIGSRFMKGGSFNDKRKWKRIISNLVNRFMTFMLGIEIHDISSGYRLMKVEVVEKIRENLIEKGYPGYMEFIIRARREGFKIAEVPIVYTPRIWGTSKIRKGRIFLDYLVFTIRLLYL